MGDQLKPLSDAEVEVICSKNRCPNGETKDFYFQHVMYRIKDPKKSLDFYVNVLGMSLLKKVDIEGGSCSLYFLGFEDMKQLPAEPEERRQWVMGRRSGLLELTHNWGSENDPNQAYHSGNKDPRGFGHIAIAVPDVEKACQRFERLGVSFQKKPNEGRMNNLAFLLDPDGYWIEIFASIP